jgi:hypothetical protein
MKLGIDSSWLLRMAEKENNKIISVGGLVARITSSEGVAPTQLKKEGDRP